MNKALDSSLNLSVYCVSGEDATSFLQGQLTQDMATTDKEWKYAAHCNPKGRVISIYQTFKLEDIHYLITPAELAEEAIAQMQKYVMRSKVFIEKSSLAVYFVNNAKTTMATQSFCQDDNNDIILSLSDLGLLKLSNTTQESNNQADWDSTRIQLGVPRIHPATLGEFTPEAINLDILGAVSFTKGCYTGQEIVARMHYLGKAKQRLHRFSLESKDMISPNSIIENVHGEKIGFIIDIDQNGTALGSLKINKIEHPLSVQGSNVRDFLALESSLG